MEGPLAQVGGPEDSGRRLFAKLQGSLEKQLVD